ncbi:phage major capsid protein [Hafnia alvei]|uniref:phage major capsid protein n=1 Tax=Hafnia alvei TaxID=569 RepID=UPI000B76887E|nr:phage major capsid protein [Hafnia alvei]MBI0275668.1 phage major capsid protein [Hafnia alvei]PNK98346.1 phage major capsid protein [Hafnia alvei]
MTNRAYSTVLVKSFDDDLREISGIASTPEPDCYSDTMSMKGVEFKLPMPFLWQHRHLAPVGNVTEAEVKSDGIHIKASLVKPTSDMPQDLIDRLNEAWASIKTGLVRGLSIGFRPIEVSYLDNGGINFIKWEWYELSAVTVPANGDCSIQTIKSLDREQLAASGKGKTVVRLNTPAGAPAPKQKNFEGKTMNISEQIKGFENKRASLSAAMTALFEKAATEGRTLDAQEEEQYEGHAAEIKSVDTHLSRLKEMEKIDLGTAKSVTTKAPDPQSTDNPVRDNARAPGIIHIEKDLEKGVAFARFVKCLATANGIRSEALLVAKNQYQDDLKLHHVLKAAVNAGTTTDPAWAGSLVEYQQFAGDFIEFLRPQTIVGRFGQNGIPALHNVPFKVSIPMQTTGGSAGWVGEGKAKPLTSFGFDNVKFEIAKIAAISVLTEELVRLATPAADTLVRNQLAAAVIARMDTDFVDPDKAKVAGVSPASITNGITGIPSTGRPESDIEAAFSQFIAANLTPASGVWLMSSTTALSLSMMRNPLGQKVYPDMTLLGGSFSGLPVIVSEYVGNQLILVNASDIYLADDGQVVVDMSREASLEMSASPAGDSTSGTGAELVSMWQTNSVAIRAERWINWQRRRDQAVAVITGVNYSIRISS